MHVAAWAILAFCASPMAPSKHQPGVPALEVTRARIGRELVVGYRVRNPTARVVWFVCPEPRCSAGDWPRVPFARREGASLILSAYVAVPPPDVFFEAPYLHELTAIPPGTAYEGVIALPTPLRSNIPYTTRASSELDLGPITAVELELGTLPCLDEAYTVEGRSRVSPGALLSCGGGRTVQTLQSIVRATRVLSR